MNRSIGEHKPVLRDEVRQVLNIQPGAIVVDCTLGLAGHAADLLALAGPTGRVIGVDLDAENVRRAQEKLANLALPFELHHANFAGLPAILAGRPVDALIADLGFASPQVDDPSRGMSYMRDGPLDMRLDQSRGQPAAHFVNHSSERELAAAFRDLGDEPRADAIAHAIVAARPIERTVQLRKVIEQAAPVRVEHGPGQAKPWQQKLKPVARVFQALRLLVNREIPNLSALLRALPDVLAPGGTAAIISFHSGEDRLVKQSFRDGLAHGVYSAISDEPIRATFEEKRENARSRSAKLRWARKS